MPTNEQISVVLTANIDNYKKNMSIATEALVELQKQSTLFVKINQSVADSFTKIDFAAKQFGETVGVLEKKLEVIKKGMTNLAVAGEQNTRAFKDLDNQYRIITNRLENKAMAEAQAYAQANMTNNILPQTKKSLDAASESLKKSNIQWTSLALVVQDLPFGFRGIQNNLPALFGSLATGTGEAYFAFSALIAVITAWDMGVFGAKKSVDAFAESTKKLNDEVKNSINYSNSNIQRLQALVTIGNDYTKSESLRAKALKEIKDELGKVNKEEADKITNIENGTQAVYTYIAALRAQQLAEVTGKKIAELQLQISEDRNKIASATGKGVHILDWLGLTDSDLQAAQNRVIQAEGLLRRLEDLNISATIQGLNNPYTKTEAPAKIKETTKPKEKVKKEKIDYFDILKTTKEFYDAKLNFAEGDEAAQQEVLYREKQTFDELIAANQISYNDYYNHVSTIYKSLVDFQSKEDKRLHQTQIDLTNKRTKDEIDSYSQRISYFKQFYNTQLDLASGNRIQQKAIIEQQLSDLVYLFSQGLIYYDDYINLIGDANKAWVSNAKAISTEATNYLLQIGNGLMSALGPSLDALLEKGANLGDVLAQAFKSILVQLAKVIISAGIAAILLSIIFPKQLTAAKMTGGDLFGKLFSQGMGLGGMMFNPPAVSNSTSSPKAPSAQSNSINITGKIAGNDILLVSQKAQRNNTLSF